MTFRVYLRWPGQRVTNKTTTESRTIAEAAYRELLERTDLVGQQVDAALTEDGKQIAYHRFEGAGEAQTASASPPQAPSGQEPGH